MCTAKDSYTEPVKLNYEQSLHIAYNILQTTKDIASRNAIKEVSEYVYIY
jgi:hypothetical protein